MKDSIQDRIYINPAIHFGKPCIKNTRIPIFAILELIAADISFDEIIKRINEYRTDIGKQSLTDEQFDALRRYYRTRTPSGYPEEKGFLGIF